MWAYLSKFLKFWPSKITKYHKISWFCNFIIIKNLNRYMVKKTWRTWSQIRALWANFRGIQRLLRPFWDIKIFDHHIWMQNIPTSELKIFFKYFLNISHFQCICMVVGSGLSRGDVTMGHLLQIILNLRRAGPGQKNHLPRA